MKEMTSKSYKRRLATKILLSLSRITYFDSQLLFLFTLVNENTPYYANPLYITTKKIKTLLQLTLSTSSHIMKLLPFVIAQLDQDDCYCKLIYSRSFMVAGKCAILIINETQIYRPPNGQNGTNVNKPRNMQTSGAPTSVNVYIFLWKFGIF